MEDKNIKDEYLRQLNTLPPLVAGKLLCLQEQVDAQAFVIGWILGQLDRLPGLPQDHVLRFLSAQANELENNPDHEELVASLDFLNEQVRLWKTLESDKS